MTGYSNIVEEALSTVEQEVYAQEDKEYEIYVKNLNSDNKVSLKVTKGNDLGQVFEATAADLGIMEGKVPIFINKDGQSCVDSRMTLGEFGIFEGDVLSINPDGNVAAV